MNIERMTNKSESVGPEYIQAVVQQKPRDYEQYAANDRKRMQEWLDVCKSS